MSFDTNVSTMSLIGWNHIERSLMDNATTLLLNADTGDIVAHFIERDKYDLNFGVPSQEPDLLIMQPARALEFNTTYIVAVGIYELTVVMSMLVWLLLPQHSQHCVIKTRRNFKHRCR